MFAYREEVNKTGSWDKYHLDVRLNVMAHIGLAQIVAIFFMSYAGLEHMTSKVSSLVKQRI